MTTNKRSRQTRALAHVENRITLWGGSDTEAMRAALGLEAGEELLRTVIDNKLAQAEAEKAALNGKGIR